MGKRYAREGRYCRHMENLESRTLLSANALSTDLFPIVDGATWNYKYKISGKTIDASMSMDVNNQGVATLDWGNTPYVFALTGQYKVGQDGVYMLGQNFMGYAFGFDNTLFLPEEVTASKTTKLGGTVSTGYGSATYAMNFTGSVQTGGWSAVTVPAGTYNALKVTYKWTITGTISNIDTPYGGFGNIKYSYTLTNDMYLVQGIGMVKGALNVKVNANGHSAGASVASFELTSFNNLPGAKADLTIDDATYKSGIYNPSTPFNVTVNQFNTGSTSVPGSEPLTIKAILSTDKIWGNSDDVDLTSVLNNSGLTIGKIQKLKLSGLPDISQLAPGNYYLGIQIDGGELKEFSTENNTWWSAMADVIVPTTLGVTSTGDESAAETTGDQSANTGTFRVSRGTGDGSLPEITAGFTLSGTATRGKDYVLKVNGVTITGNTVTIAQGDLYTDVTVVPMDDVSIEKLETVTLALKANKNLYNIAVDAAKATVSIADLALPIVSVKPTAATANEKDAHLTKNQGMLLFTRINTDAAASLSITVALTGTASSSIDYTLVDEGGNTISVVSGKITVAFAAGAKTAKVFIKAADDTVLDPGETIIATIQMPTGGNPAYRPALLAKDYAATIVIKDNDIAPDGILGTTLKLSMSGYNDVTKKSASQTDTLYFGDNEVIDQGKNGNLYGTYTYTKTGNGTATLNITLANGNSYSLNLTFSSATAGKISGSGSIGGSSIQFSGSLTLAVSKVESVVSSLANQVLTLKPASVSSGSLSSYTEALSSTKLTRSGAEAPYNYAYASFGDFGIATIEIGDSLTLYQLMIYSKGKTHSYLLAGSDGIYWERGTFTMVPSDA